MSAQASSAQHALGQRCLATGCEAAFRETGREAAMPRLAALAVVLGLTLADRSAPFCSACC